MAPDTERPPAELVNETAPPVVSGPPTVPRPEEFKVKFLETAKVPEPVVTVDPLLVSDMSCLALMTSVPVPRAPDEESRTLVALMTLVKVMVEAEDVISTSPPEEVIEASVVFVKAPDPRSTTLLTA